jgi:hypothetical protein
MANKFDDFSKELAERHSRRGMLKFLGAGVIGAAVATVAGSKVKDAEAAPRWFEVLNACKGYRGIDFLVCLKDASCSSRGGESCGEGLHSICCPPGTMCMAINETQSSGFGVRRRVFCQPVILN